MHYDVIVIGGGAAGLFCAIEAGKRRRRTLVIEHNAEVGRKIIISGGGRCNFTNVHTTPDNFISENPHFCKSALARYTPNDFVRLVQNHRVAYYEKKLGQLFCRNSSREIVGMLLRECRDAKVHILTGCSVSTIARERNFDIETTAGPFQCEKLVIATGGLSFPKIGATDFGYLAAKQFGLKIVPTRPSLVPLVADDELDHSTLAGISLEAEVSAGRYSFRENILFTHRGFSGPAILQISNYWDRKIPVVIDLFPGRNARAILESGRLGSQQLANFLSGYLPAKFAAMFPGEETARRRMNQFADRELDEIAKRLNNWQVRFRETEGYAKAEVTAGGVSTDELSSATMEAKRVPGLYFIGEVVDVTGWLGGYNFQWAWSSGYAAGRVL